MGNNFASVKELQDFTGVYPEDDKSQQELFLSSATDIIINYLGYDPHKMIRSEELIGSGDGWLFLGVKHLNKVESLMIDGASISADRLTLRDSSITLKDGVFPKGANILVSYDAGWEIIPDVIKLTCLRIASLLQTEAGDNIGITSKSFGDSGSRTFYNFTNFNKYLLQLSAYQIY